MQIVCPLPTVTHVNLNLFLEHFLRKSFILMHMIEHLSRSGTMADTGHKQAYCSFDAFLHYRIADWSFGGLDSLMSTWAQLVNHGLQFQRRQGLAHWMRAFARPPLACWCEALSSHWRGAQRRQVTTARTGNVTRPRPAPSHNLQLGPSHNLLIGLFSCFGPWQAGCSLGLALAQVVLDR